MSARTTQAVTTLFHAVTNDPSGEGRASTPQQPALTKTLTGIVGERGHSHQLSTASTGFGPTLCSERQDHTPPLPPKEKPGQKRGTPDKSGLKGAC